LIDELVQALIISQSVVTRGGIVRSHRISTCLFLRPMSGRCWNGLVTLLLLGVVLEATRRGILLAQVLIIGQLVVT